MVKKKLSGQTIAIIILAVLLLLTITFGGVFAFYSAKSNKISGKIIMANLKIGLYSNNNVDRSVVVISNGENVVPGQDLQNSPLLVENSSSASIYLVIVYEINAVKLDENGEKKVLEIIDGKKIYDTVNDEKLKPVIDIGATYRNPYNNITYSGSNTNWVDYLFSSSESGEFKQYRCLVSMVSFYNRNADPINNPEEITVIGENQLKFSKHVGNDYQNTSISFTFQAYAIGSNTNFGWSSNPTTDEKCEKIVSAIYTNEEYEFLKVQATT